MKNIRFRYEIADMLLNVFYKSRAGYIGKQDLCSDHLPDQDEVLAFLVSEGLLDENPYGYKITYKGRITVDKGGLYGAWKRKLITYICTIVAAIAGVIAILVAFL